MQIDYDKAKQVLEQEAVAAVAGSVSEGWVTIIKRLEQACGQSNLTFIAALGTALLAKATHLQVDVTTLKAGAGQRAYSARTLATKVLAAHARRLGIDLGVHSREPLNNQPFFAEKRVTESFPVSPQQRPALRALLDALGELSRIDREEEARLALRTFLQLRRRTDGPGPLQEGAGHGLSLEQLVAAAALFVAERSERGKRAQAVAAALLDVAFGEGRVVASGVYDPDRRFPGDVAVRESDRPESSVVRVFEVRDKLVSSEDVMHFAAKAMEAGVHHAGVIAIVGGQSTMDLAAGLAWARDRGVVVVVYTDWLSFATDAVFWSQGAASDPVADAYRRIFARLEEFEVSRSGIETWRAMGTRY